MTKLFFVACVRATCASVCICVKVEKGNLAQEWLHTSIFWCVCSFIPSCLLTSDRENTCWVFRKLLLLPFMIIYFISFFSIHREPLWLLSLQLSNWKTGLQIYFFFTKGFFSSSHIEPREREEKGGKEHTLVRSKTMKIEFIYYSHILFFRKNGKRTQEFDTLDNTMLKPHKGYIF